MHDADTAGGPGVRQASFGLDQALMPGSGMLAGLAALRADGTIDNVSLGMNAHRKHMGGWEPSVIIDLIEAAPEGTIDSALLAYGWNLLCQDGLEVMECCQKHGIRVHIAGTMGGEQYSIFRPTDENKGRLAHWQALAEEHGVSLPAIAISFACLPSCVEKVIMGMSTPDEVEMNMNSLKESAGVPAAIWKEAQAAGLLPAGLKV